MIETWNERFKKPVFVVHPGEMFATAEDAIISTVLGSCVAVVLYDPGLKVCGMNHFMLARAHYKPPREHEARYGTFAMSKLVQYMKDCGSEKGRLTAKVFGGGHILNLDDPREHLNANEETSIDAIPSNNVRFAFEYLRDLQIPVMAEDTGGICGRKILIFAQDGAVLLKRFYGQNLTRTAHEERDLIKKLNSRHRVK